MGGSVTGDAEVTQWLNPQPAGPVRERKRERSGKAGRGRCVFVSRTCRPPKLRQLSPLRRVHFTRSNWPGWPAAIVEARWKGSPRNAEAQFVSRCSAAAPPFQRAIAHHRARPGHLPRRPGELQLDQLNASTRATQVHASGTLSSTAALKLSVTTTDLSEWQPVFSAAGYGGPIPVTLKGHASFNGTATGKLSEITIAGNLQSQDFETLIPATSQTPEKMVHWDALRADIQLSPSLFAVRNGTLSRNPDSLKFDFHVQLFNRQFTDCQRVSAHASTPRMPTSPAFSPWPDIHIR